MIILANETKSRWQCSTYLPSISLTPPICRSETPHLHLPIICRACPTPPLISSFLLPAPISLKGPDLKHCLSIPTTDAASIPPALCFLIKIPGSAISQVYIPFLLQRRLWLSKVLSMDRIWNNLHRLVRIIVHAQ